MEAETRLPLRWVHFTEGPEGAGVFVHAADLLYFAEARGADALIAELAELLADRTAPRAQMPPAKANQGGRFPSTYGVYGGRKFTGALHETHAPAGEWRSGPEQPWRCAVCHPPAVPRLDVERRGLQMGQHVATVRPVRIHVPSRDLATTAVRVVGWRAHCKCGFRSRTYRDRAEAVGEARWHGGADAYTPARLGPADAA